MHGKVVLVCTDRTRTWRQVTPPLASAGNQLVQAQSTDRALDLLWTGAVDLALVEWPCGVALDPVIEAAGDRVPVVVLVSETGIRGLEELICRRGLLHLCATRAEQEASTARVLDPAELVVTCEKILRQDIFGLDKYLAGFGIERPSRIVVHAEERDAVVAELVEAVRALGAGRRVAESVSLVSDELVTNAVYNAPRDADGAPRYAHVSRREKIALDPAEYVRIDYGSDGRTFGLAVTDSFGALEPGSLRSAIERCVARQDQIQQKPGGAGIGLYAALCHADQLVVNLDPGVRTEVIALWGLARKSGGRGAGVASLHVFEQMAGEADTDADLAGTTQRNVSLSDSAKSEIWAALVGGAAPAAAASPGREGEATELELVAEVDNAVDLVAEIDVDRVAAPRSQVERVSGSATLREVVLEVEPEMVLDLEAEDPEENLEADDPDADTMAVVVIDPSIPDADGESGEPQAVEADAPPAQDPSDAGEPDSPESASADPAESVETIDLADLFEMATIMEATGLLGSPSPPWLGPLTCLRGVQILRPSDGPDLDTALGRVREAPTLADAVEVLLGFLVGHWSAAMLLCRIGDTLVPWTAAGDVDAWEELCEIELPLAPGWLSARTLSPGVTLAALDEDPSARRLGDSLTGRRTDQGLALSFVLDQAVLVVFACRVSRTGAGDDAATYEEFQRELSELTARIDRFSRLPTARRQSSARAV